MYWYPLYAYVRQRGYSPEDSQDLTQEFFKRLLEKNALGSVSRCKGRFRSYLLTALNHFITDEWRRAHAQKRDAGLLIRLDEEAETRFRNEPADKVTPEKLFNQSWALSLLNRVFEKLDTEYRASGRAALFDALKFSLTGDRSSVPYSQLAKHLQLSENAVKLTVHRLRRRYRELLREEVANTVSSKDEIEPELRALFQALAG